MITNIALVVIAVFLVFGYVKIRRAQSVQSVELMNLFRGLTTKVEDTSTNIYNEVSNIWLETNRAKLKPQFCSLLIMHPGGVEGALSESSPCLMATSMWLGPDQEHTVSFAPDIVIPANTLIVVTGPCDLQDIIIANRHQGFFTTPLGQVGITKNQATPGHRVTIRVKGWPLRPSTLSEAELVREAQKRAEPPWNQS